MRPTHSDFAFIFAAVVLQMVFSITCPAQNSSALPPTSLRVGEIGAMPLMFTTKAYHDEALKQLLVEANQIAAALQLPESLPLAETNIVKVFVNPYGYACRRNSIGTVTSSNYCYYVSAGNKFSYLESPHQDELCRKFQASHTLPLNQINTNEALQLARQWLADCPWT